MIKSALALVALLWFVTVVLAQTFPTPTFNSVTVINSIIAQNLPSSCGAAPFGTLWNNLGIISICQGSPTGIYATSSKTSSPYAVSTFDNGTWFDNGNASGEMDFLLPSASPGLHYCFAVTSAQVLKIVALAGQKITVGTFTTVVGGNVTMSLPYSNICIHAPSGNSTVWISDGTPVGSWSVN